MSVGNFPESLSQAMLVGIMLVGRLGVAGSPRVKPIWGGAVIILVIGLLRTLVGFDRRRKRGKLMNECERE